MKALKRRPYRDASGRGCNIGYGHFTKGKCLAPISDETAKQYLEKDLAQVGKDIRQKIKVDLTQGQRDALTDVFFQYGAHSRALKKLINHINVGNFDAMPDDLRKLVYVRKTVKGKRKFVRVKQIAERREGDIAFLNRDGSKSDPAIAKQAPPEQKTAAAQTPAMRPRRVSPQPDANSNK
jgi:GH24 family phage-related lysozyme (muramidase)